MVSAFLLLAAVLVAFIIQDFITKFLRWRKMPPGPWGIPILGYIPFLFKEPPYLVFERLWEKHGDIISVTLASKEQVVLNNWELIRDAFSRPEFTDRPDMVLIRLASSGHNGIVTGNGSLWQDNRRFTMRTLRDFGFGKTTLDGIISNEALALCDVFKKKAKDPFGLHYSVNVAVLNVLWKMTAGEQYAYEDARMANFIELLNLTLEDTQSLGLIQFIPILKYLYPTALQAYRRVKNRIERITDDFKGKIDEHKKNFDPDNIRDYIDAYLQEMKAQQNRGEENTNFSDLQLRVNIQNLFLIGCETTANTIRWAILFLLRNLKVQEWIQAEVDNVIGRERLPSLADRDRMPYTEAFIMEVQRHANVAPMGLPHCTNQDVEFAGYTIPKGTIVMGNLWACHFDPKYWPDPFKFDPTRFLESDGTLKTKNSSFLPFSLGKRQCLGEALAKMELFIFLTIFMQRFSFRLPEGATMPSTEPIFSAIVNRPKPFKIVAEIRT